MGQYVINSALVGLFEEKLVSFQKKFKKFGEGCLTYTKSEHYVVEKTHEYVVNVEVSGSYVIKNYEFVASLEFDEKTSSNIIKKISSDVEVPNIYRTRNTCDHCNTNRFRKYTVLLKNKETGEYIQVGKQCVVDYLGVNIENYASYISMWNSLEEYEENLNVCPSAKKEIAYSVEEILGETIEYVKKHGYISKNISYERECDSTSSMVWYAINRITDMHNKIIYDYLDISEESKNEVNEVRSFIDTTDNTDNDYLFSLSIVLKREYVEAKNFGMVVSAVGCYLRDKNNKEIEKKNKESNSEYIGNIGEKVEFVSTPKCVFSSETQFGWMYIYTFDVNGNEVVWNTSKSIEEKEVTVKGTIKELKVYKGKKQTVVTRCRLA